MSGGTEYMHTIKFLIRIVYMFIIVPPIASKQKHSGYKKV